MAMKSCTYCGGRATHSLRVNGSLEHACGRCWSDLYSKKKRTRKASKPHLGLKAGLLRSAAIQYGNHRRSVAAEIRRKHFGD